jgi:hypothetical protein
MLHRKAGNTVFGWPATVVPPSSILEESSCDDISHGVEADEPLVSGDEDVVETKYSHVIAISKIGDYDEDGISFLAIEEFLLHVVDSKKIVGRNQ